MPELELPRVPLGSWMEDFVRDVLLAQLGFLFSFVRRLMLWLIDGLESLLLLPPFWVIVILFTALAWRLRSWAFAAFTLLAFLFIESAGLWPTTMTTLALILLATLLAVAVAVPVGIAAARSRKVSQSVRPVLDFMQTLPTFVYLIPVVFLIGTRSPGALVATLVFAIPPGVRLTELGIRGVDKEVVEAAEAFGASKRQILWRVQVPLAMPAIMQGINQVIMLALSMVVVAGLIGAGGLGGEVVRALTRLDLELGFESGLSVVILAIFLDRMTSFMRDRAQV